MPSLIIFLPAPSFVWIQNTAVSETKPAPCSSSEALLLKSVVGSNEWRQIFGLLLYSILAQLLFVANMVSAVFSFEILETLRPHGFCCCENKSLKEMNSFNTTMWVSWAEFDIGKSRVHGRFQTWIWIALHSDDC